MTSTKDLESLIHQLYANRSGDWRRPRLGASRIGTPCDRALWLEFRWSAPPVVDARIHRLFDSGYREEARIIDDLKGIGIEVYDTDPNTGEQITFSDLGGHYGGSCDGVGRGFPQRPEAWYLIELKTSNKKNFIDLKKEGVLQSKPQHYAQMQAYMHGLGLDRAMYIAVCKDDDSIHAEEVPHDLDSAIALTARAERIIFGELGDLLPCDDGQQCMYCDYKSICEGTQDPIENCRTCAHSYPRREGGWGCAHHLREISTQEQKLGCKYHVISPQYPEKR